MAANAREQPARLSRPSAMIDAVCDYARATSGPGAPPPDPALERRLLAAIPPAERQRARVQAGARRPGLFFRLGLLSPETLAALAAVVRAAESEGKP